MHDTTKAVRKKPLPKNWRPNAHFSLRDNGQGADVTVWGLGAQA